MVGAAPPEDTYTTQRKFGVDVKVALAAPRSSAGGDRATAQHYCGFIVVEYCGAVSEKPEPLPGMRGFSRPARGGEQISLSIYDYRA